ncbi:hypothetical protein M0805_003597 [Coniferiporia weirii]|nr:hypothetical protein M0805_003597 [Coniferiporia weirii]
MSLDNFLTSATPLPTALATSNTIYDRDSTFVGALYRAASPAAARRALAHHTHVVHGARPASHEIAAWRCIALRAGRDGLRGPEDFELATGAEDDGEQGGARAVLRTMEREGVLDAVVIVSRWFGGTMLGPVRFAHIETCAREVCRTFRALEDVEGVIEELKGLNTRLARLRAELAALSDSSPSLMPDVLGAGAAGPGSSQTAAREVDYTAMLLRPTPDLPRAKRLVAARMNAIRSVSGLIARSKGGSTVSSSLGAG